MFNLMLMMALSNGSALPSVQETPAYAETDRFGDQGHRLYRGLRHRRGGGCCGCSGGYGGYGGYGYGGCGPACGADYGSCCGYGFPGASPYAQPVPKGEAENGDDEEEEGDNAQNGNSDQESRLRSSASPATLVVTLPANAKLRINGLRTQSTSATRRFVSPPLTKGKIYHYRLEAAVKSQGRTITTVRDVTVRAGQVKRVALDFSSERVAQK